MAGSFETTKEKIETIVAMFFLGVIILWPVFLTLFLMYNRKELNKRLFKKRFESMYLGIKTDAYVAKAITIGRANCFLFNVVFCLRRLSIVLTFYFLHESHINQVLYAILGI